MNWKQLFCRHIWKELGKEWLGTTKEGYVGVYVRYNRYALELKCIKCGKKKFKERWVETL